MHRCLAHTVGPVANIHAPALKAVGKSVRYGVAKGAQLAFQLLLHPAALVSCIVSFSRSFINFLTLLPVHTG